MRALPYIAFFLSGASSLIFQALWTRMLHHTFGATSVAMSTVLSAFMSGLGLGAYWFGKRAARFKNPLAVYAAAELGVALCALVIPPLVRSDGFFALVNAALRQSLGEGSFAFMVARFFCVLPILLVPTTLMGGTLPLLAQHFVARDPDGAKASARVGLLYALNTFGAVAGTFLSSFVLMPAIGVRATNFVAVGINAALGIAIFLLQRGSKGAAPSAHTASAPTSLDQKRRIALIAFGLSGVCSMAYEVVWSRALSMAIGSSLQSFALILITFLVGIAGGSGVASRLLGSPAARGLVILSVASWLLAWLGLMPAIVLSSAPLALGILLALALGLTVFVRTSLARAQALSLADEELRADAERSLERAALSCLWLPCAIVVFELVRFSLKQSKLADVAVHGYLPYVTASVVGCIALWLAVQTALRRSPWLLAAALQLGIAVATLVGYAYQDEIPYSFARLVSALDDLPAHVGTVRFFMLLAAGLCTLPASLGMGAMFPLTLELWASGHQASVGDDVGRVYGANTIGSILGAWLPGFVLLPLLGMERTLALGMAVNAGVALLLLWAARSEAAPRMVRAIAGTAVALLALLAVHTSLAHSPLSWNLSHMTLGAFRVSLANEVLDPEAWGQPDLVYYRDGIATTVSVERWGAHLSLKNNGKVDASNGDDMATQIMVSAYPLLFHPKGPRDLDVAIVGFGSGVTVGAALQFPLRHVDDMELEDAVVDAALRHFADVNHMTRKHERFPYVEHPRLTLYRDDGRNFLAATPHHYDVIVSEPSNPWITGVSDLFTVDHFDVTKPKLKPGGVYCQWVQLYELSPENIKTVYRTFASHFRYVIAFAAEQLSSDTILLGSDTPFTFDLAHVEASLRDPRVAAELARAHVHSAYDVYSRMLFASREELLRFAQTETRVDAQGQATEMLRATGAEPCVAPSCFRKPAPLNTDDNMLIELRAPSDLIGFKRYAGYLDVFYGAGWPYGDFTKRIEHVDGDAKQLALALSLVAHGRKERARGLLARRPVVPLDPALRLDQRTLDLMLGNLPEPAVTFEPATPSAPMTPEMRANYERVLTATEQAYDAGDFGVCARVLERLPEPLRTLSGPGLRLRHALAVYRSPGRDHKQLKAAIAELEQLIRGEEAFTRTHPELYYFLARALEAAHQDDKAVLSMRRYAELTLPRES